MWACLRQLGHSALLLWTSLAMAATAIPEQLADYGVLKREGNTLRVAGNTMVYQLAAPLFTDYALKFRTLTLPAGAKVGYQADEVWDLPIGTVISKTFFYARDPAKPGGWLKGNKLEGGEQIDLEHYRLVETRILRRDVDGNWQANTYVWNEAQTEARLRRIGQEVVSTLRDPASGKVAELRYGVPNARQCQTCHAVDSTRGQTGIQPIGIKTRYLNIDYLYRDGRSNQLVKLGRLGSVDGLPAELASLPTAVAYADPKAGSLDARARSYLEINCMHCHNSLGDARQSGLLLTPTAEGSALGVCKQHVAAGAGGADLAYDIVPGKPEQSLLLSRLQATGGQAIMPRIGRSLVDEDGIRLIREWITAMPGDCVVRR
ncbi:SO2930 family diheme c-type cytochrome [Chitinimonas sp.]|uniref:SO2930 family diheme c-type cytochrome n=1 Tax=Chitinimonas sp. TaxID=1934313 RepID=UPI002F94BD06